MKKTIKKIFKEFDENGNLIRHTEETIEEETKENEVNWGDIPQYATSPKIT